MNSFMSVKYQTTIYYYSNDIDYCESGEYSCNGQDEKGNEYNITFTEKNGAYYIDDVNRR